jgi:LysM repeat protein
MVYEIWGPSWGHLRTMIGCESGEVGAGMAYSASGMVYYALNVCAGAEVPTSIPGQATATNAPYFAVIVSTPDANGAVYHVVNYGQTLWSIATEYGVLIDEIRQLNNMAGDSTLITVGQKLLIRKTDAVGQTANTLIPTSTPINTNTPEMRRITPSITTTRPGEGYEISQKDRKIGIAIGILFGIAGAFTTLWFSSKVSWRKRNNKKKGDPD